jgi:hypothetical protein
MLQRLTTWWRRARHAIPCRATEEEDKKEGISSAATRLIRSSRKTEAFAVKEDKATPTIRGYITKIEVEIKKDGALIKDAKDQVLSSVVNGKDAGGHT